MKFYIYNWYKFTFPILIFLCIYMIFFGQSFLSSIQIILMYNFISLLFHQFEEYLFPGGAPAFINIATFGEKVYFRNYPGNMLSSMFVNLFAHLIYIFAIFFPQYIWLGLSIMFFNIFQFIGHGLQMNKVLKTWYNPGLFSVVFFFIPISIYYMIFVIENQLVTSSDWIYGSVTFIVIVIFTVILPVQVLKDKNSVYKIPEWQVKQFIKVRNFASLSKK